MTMYKSVALYEQRRAEMVQLVGEERVRQMEIQVADDYILYGARKPSTDDPPLKGILG